MKTFVRLLIICVAVWAAMYLVPGIHVEGTQAWIAVAIMGLVLGILNATLKPVLKLASGCLIFLTFGLFCLIIDAGILCLSAWICHGFLGVGFYVDGFWPAFWGGLVISVVTVILDAICGVGRSR